MNTFCFGPEFSTFLGYRPHFGSTWRLHANEVRVFVVAFTCVVLLTREISLHDKLCITKKDDNKIASKRTMYSFSKWRKNIHTFSCFGNKTLSEFLSQNFLFFTYFTSPNKHISYQILPVLNYFDKYYVIMQWIIAQNAIVLKLILDGSLGVWNLKMQINIWKISKFSNFSLLINRIKE